MRDNLFPLKLPPGLFRAGTIYETKGRWYDANLVRFFERTVQPIGGWVRAVDDAGTALAAISGVPRAAKAWSSDTGDLYIGIGTTEKLYVLAGGVMRDITPAGFTVGAEDTTLSGGVGAYSAGAYGSGAYGRGPLTAALVPAATWQLDTYGVFLAGVSTSDNKLYIWENVVTTPAAVPANAPASVRAVVCTPERFLFALGAGGNVRRVQWPSRETTTVWTPSATETAGQFDLNTDGRIVCGRRTKSSTLIWTDADLHIATWIGGQFVYRFDQVADKCGIVAPNAVAIIDTKAFWLGRENFFQYDGYVTPIPCDVWDAVFSDFNSSQIAKVWATSCAQYGEVTWFYPSGGSLEVDRYVTYNYREQHWTLGRLARTAGFDAGASALPIMLSPDGLIYEHEVGEDRDGEEPYIESGPVELGSGDRTISIYGLVPDERTLGDVSATLFLTGYPTEAETEVGPITLAASTDFRHSARLVRVRLTQARETSWRVGTMRLRLTPGGRR